MQIMKFGGSALKSAKGIELIQKRVEESEDKIVVVVSAFHGVTDFLVKLCNSLEASDYIAADQTIDQLEQRHLEIIAELEIETKATEIVNSTLAYIKNICTSVQCLRAIDDKVRDMILSLGELTSYKIIGCYLAGFSEDVESIDPRKFIVTDNNYSSANIDIFTSRLAVNKNLLPLFKSNRIVVTGGFTGITKDGFTTTLGRGGSDYTASVIGCLLNASKIILWKDVDGVLSIDPKFVSKVKVVPRLDYQEALELSSWGGKVVSKKTIFPAMKSSIPLHIKNVADDSEEGTLINDFKDDYLGTKILAISQPNLLIKIDFMDTDEKQKVIDYLLTNRETADDTFCFLSVSDSGAKLCINRNREIDGIFKDMTRFGRLQIFRDISVLTFIGSSEENQTDFKYKILQFFIQNNIPIVDMDIHNISIRIVIGNTHLSWVQQNIDTIFERYQ